MAATQRATERPSLAFSRAGSALRLLETEGVDTLEFFQRIIDDPTYRHAVIDLALPSFTALGIPRAPRPGSVERLLRAVFGKSVDSQLDFSAHERHFLSDCLLPDSLSAYLSGLDARTITYLVLTYSLDGNYHTQPEVRLHLSVNNAVLDRLDRDACKTIYMRYLRWLLWEAGYTRSAIKVEALRFSRDTRYCLRQNGIATLAELVNRPRGRLDKITLNRDVLNEITSLVDALGLKFADE